MMNMPPITKNLIIINVLLFFAMFVGNRYGVDLNDVLGLHFFLASDFRWYQFVTYMFMHANLEHILFNMFAVWMFGRVMESVWGPRRFLLYYMICGIGAGVMQELVQFATYCFSGLDTYDNVRTALGQIIPMENYLNAWNTVGASGAVYGILLAFGMTFPDERMFVFPLPVPIKAKYFVMGYAVLELLLGFGRSADGVAHFAHLGGMLFGLLLIMYWRKPRRGNGYGGGYYHKEGNIFTRFFKQFTSWRRPKMKVYMGKRKDDMDYNAQRKMREKEVDRILEKVKRHGYGSLTEEEKRTLFDASQR